jgi:hypothetical protein
VLNILLILWTMLFRELPTAYQLIFNQSENFTSTFIFMVYILKPHSPPVNLQKQNIRLF